MKTQPLNLNHEGETITEILGFKSKEEFSETMDNLDLENQDNIAMMTASTMMAAFKIMPDSQKALIVAIFQIIYDEDFKNVSQIAEKVANAAYDRQQLGLLISIVAKEAMVNEFRGA